MLYKHDISSVKNILISDTNLFTGQINYISYYDIGAIHNNS